MALCCNKMYSFAKEMKVHKLINFSTFSPPTKVNYTITGDDLNDDFGSCYKKVNFTHQEYSEVNFPFIDIECYILKKCTDKKKLVLLDIKNSSKKQNKLTIIFSHGGSSDLGLCYPFLIDLSTQLKVKLSD
jgi:hypothetical protein